MGVLCEMNRHGVLYTLYRIAEQGAGHTMPATTPAAQLRSLKFQYIDTGLTEIPVGRRVPVGRENETGPDCKDIISVIPLLAGSFAGIATGWNNFEVVNVEGIGNCT